MLSWKKLITPPDKSPKDIKEWLALITNSIKGIKGSENWYDDVSLLTSDNIVNDLDTGGIDKILSSEQGKILNEKVNTLNSHLDTNSNEIDIIKNSFNNKYYPSKKGMNIWMVTETSTNDIDDIVSKCEYCGINSVFLAVYHNQENMDVMSNVIIQQPSDSIIKYAIDKFKSVNIEVIIKPHVQNNSSVNPNDKVLFLNNWFSFVRKYAQFSVEKGLERIIISNELSNLDSLLDTTQWDTFISEIKSMGLKVGVTFAGFQRYDNCNFRSNLDFIGVNFYPRVSGGVPTTPLKDVKIAMSNNIDFEKIRKCKEESKEFYISEIGCTKYIKGMQDPSGWEMSGAKDNRVHQLYYDAFYTILGCQELVDGIYIWVGSRSNEDATFNPFGNPLAEETIKSYIVGGV